MNPQRYSVWLLCRGSENFPDAASLDLIRIAAQMPGTEKCSFTAVTFGEALSRFPAPVEQVIQIPSPPGACADTQARSFAALADSAQPDIILSPATLWGRTLMSISAALMNTGLTADCIALSVDDEGLLHQTRPAYGGKLLAEILITKARPQMATRRTRSSYSVPASQLRELPCMTAPITADPYAGAMLIQRLLSGSSVSGLKDSSIVVAGGLGLGNRENFQVIHQLAALLGGAVAASRAAVNEGFAPYTCQVGQSGHVIAPKLYLAIGISGAAQHLSGIHGAGRIVAVNPDPKAPIFEYADVGILSPWKPFAEALKKQLK